MVTSCVRCIVIGGRGYVGSAITAAVHRLGWDIIVVETDNYSRYVGSTCDVLINANGNAQRFRANHDPFFDFDASTRPVYRSLFDFGSSHYVLISTADVYNDPTSPTTTRENTSIDPLTLSPYGFHKRLAELCVMRSAQSWQIFRLAQMVGPGLCKGPIFDVLNRRPLWIHRDTCLPYMHTHHVAQAILDLVQNAPRNDIYNMCGRGTVPFKEVLELLPSSHNSTTWADRESQVYRVNTDKVHSLRPLPDSQDEIQAFIREILPTMYNSSVSRLRLAPT